MEELEVAQKAAQEAAQVAMFWKDKKLEITAKTHATDLVSQADKEAEKAAVSLIKEHFPNDGFIGEENNYQTRDRNWIIDPIDGTHNYLRDIPYWCSGVALEEQGEIKVSCIYDACREEIYTSQRGKGAFLNEKKINTRHGAVLEDSLIVFYTRLLKSQDPIHQRILQSLAKSTGGIRYAGSCLLDLAWVANGRLDASVKINLEPWDWEAGKLLVQEAGGIADASNWYGDKWYIAATWPIHQKLLDIIAKDAF